MIKERDLEYRRVIRKSDLECRQVIKRIKFGSDAEIYDEKSLTSIFVVVVSKERSCKMFPAHMIGTMLITSIPGRIRVSEQSSRLVFPSEAYF